MIDAVLAHTWEAEGERLGESCDEVTSAVVIGDKPEAAAALALGIARVQGRRRRVAIGDLAGGDGLLQELARSEDIHGLVDSFLYGVSLTHIARPLEGHENVFILPCGSEQASEEILTNPRWRRLTAGFREVEALLLLVAPSGAPGLPSLVAATEGVILADSAANAGGPVIAAAERSRVEPSTDERDDDVGDLTNVPPPVAEVEESAPVAVDALEAQRGWPYVERRRGPRHGALRRALPAIAAAALLAVAAGGIWLGRTLNRREAAADDARTLAAARHQDSAAAAVAQPSPVPLENPADSAIASRYAIEVGVANTQEGATASLPELRRLALPAATVGLFVYPGDTTLWFRIVVGATPDAAAADSLLGRLRASGRFAGDASKVVRVPVALLLERDLEPEPSRMRVVALRSMGIPAYALAQADGTARVYAGAFETPDQTVLLAEQLRAAGLAPVAAYRTGRPF
jgi:hypothetical protein